MRLAYTIASDRGGTDTVVAALADRLIGRGLRVCGTVQFNTEVAGDVPCDMDVRVLPVGPKLRITQDLGKGSRGCRLNPSALETAVGYVSRSLSGGVDLVVINKFGKQEAAGGGFRNLIGMALAEDTPVLVGVSSRNRDAFESFAEGLATAVPANIGALERWVAGALAAESVPA